MKLQITTPATKDGMGRPDNPLPFSMRHQQWLERHPPLLILDQDNNPVKDGWTGEVTGPHKAYCPYKGAFKADIIDSEKDAEGIKANGWEVFEVYKVSDAPEKQLFGNSETLKTAPLSDKSDVEERAAKLYPKLKESNTDRKVEKLRRAYIHGATDQEKLMQGERVKVKKALEDYRELLNEYQGSDYSLYNQAMEVLNNGKD